MSLHVLPHYFPLRRCSYVAVADGVVGRDGAAEGDRAGATDELADAEVRRRAGAAGRRRKVLVGRQAYLVGRYRPVGVVARGFDPRIGGIGAFRADRKSTRLNSSH